MKNLFLITSRGLTENERPNSLDLVSSSENYQFYANKKDVVSFGNVKILIDGYVLPRNEHFKTYKDQDQATLIYKLFIKYGYEFTNYMKGIFSVIIVKEDSLCVANDQLGINKYFYYSNNKIIISNSFQLVTKFIVNKKPNYNIFAGKAILNRVVNGETIISDVFYSQPATLLKLNSSKLQFCRYWNHKELLKNKTENHDFQYFANLIKKNIINYQSYLNPQNYSITLTGGKDSRTALAALLSNGIKPVGITYGNPLSKDATYARLMAKKAGIKHEIVDPATSSAWFEVTAKEIINFNNPLINIHRSHRYYALKKIHEIMGHNTAYYGGYMGGELLMGVYYDNLIFTKFLTDAWESGYYFENIFALLSNCFIKKEAVDMSAISETLSNLRTLDDTLSKKLKQFHGLFEIGVLHHSQDLQIAQYLLDYPIPFFLDLDFLEALFLSKHTFLYKNNKTKNLLKRHRLFTFNVNIQHILYPKFDDVPFAKRGSYNTNEFLQGPIYWSMVKAYRYFTEKRKYPPTFVYNNEYKKFILKWLNEIVHDNNSLINEAYDVPAAFTKLKNSPKLTTESAWHPYSNIVMHYLQIKHYLT